MKTAGLHYFEYINLVDSPVETRKLSMLTAGGPDYRFGLRGIGLFRQRCN